MGRDWSPSRTLADPGEDSKKHGSQQHERLVAIFSSPAGTGSAGSDLLIVYV
jgi:hypothetical protein